MVDSRTPGPLEPQFCLCLLSVSFSSRSSSHETLEKKEEEVTSEEDEEKEEEEEKEEGEEEEYDEEEHEEVRGLLPACPLTSYGLSTLLFCF